MSSELSLTSKVLLNFDNAKADKSSVQPHTSHDVPDAERAIQASRRQFVEEIAKEAGLEQGRLVIEKDTDTGRFVHKLVDPDSGEVVRQWPEESWLEFAKAHHAPNGLWVNKRA